MRIYKKTSVLIAALLAVLAATFAMTLYTSPSLADGRAGQCDDRTISDAIQEIIGRRPTSSGTGGECNAQRYGTTWPNIATLKQNIRSNFFTGRHASEILARERCFGAQGQMCSALAVGLSEGVKAGRTVNSDGTFNIYTSVGSINHDNCCLANPNGKMCGGNAAANDPFGNGNGKCVAEWDKAWWNALDGRAWSARFDPRAVPNLAIVSNPRQARSRTGQELVRFETVATRNLKAPRGQALDVGDDEFCASGQADRKSAFGKSWIECR
ncbi:hypothetical protein [Asticcacaulis sp. AC466]|uniref:hypothetical protein n=1 Tax=Asticcacaulis sp. AC466 TaxID=1282362 RepID=UPI0004280180|nr:hypothetical protein [Asticcacaulis sp. AC466]